MCSWDRTLSYGELDSLSSRLAGLLAVEGVGPESIVPLLFEKSSWAVVSMLAVMKAGGAFLPMDISQPLSRLASIVDETGATFALASTGCFVICSTLVDNAFAVTESTIEDIKAPLLSHGPATLGNAVYLMATSGSTGTPKRVVTEHLQLSSFVASLTEPLGFTVETRAFQFASYAFDPIIGDIFLTLAAGGTVCIPSEEERKNDIIGAMKRMRVNLAKFTPSLVSSLVTLTPGSVPTLRTLILGGETSPPAMVETWVGKIELKFIYGSTECTVSCVVPDAGASTIEPGEIGRPTGSHAWVINPQNPQELVEDGEIGELLIQGPLVARGYLGDQAQTQAKFIGPPKWFDATQELTRTRQRMYRTGDLVRRLANGRLVYVGRSDNQVKIHGQRLELEEVEQHLHRALSTIDDVRIKHILVDSALTSGAPTKQLIAFLSLESEELLGGLLCDDERGATISLSPRTQRSFANLVFKIESHMKMTVPSYMIPSFWVPISNMPYTISKKRDRQRLRKAVESLPSKWLAAFHQADDSVFANGSIGNAVLSQEESLLQNLWSDVLCMDAQAVKPHDNFFFLGGNSLLAMKLVSMAREKKKHLVVDDVFNHPILQDLATKLAAVDESDLVEPFTLLDAASRHTIQNEAADQCSISPDNIEDIYPLYSMQNHYVEGYPELGRDITGPWGWQQQILFQLPDSFDTPRFKAVWSRLLDRHSQLRTRVVKTSHGVFQVVLRTEAAPKWRDVDDLDEYVRSDIAAVMSFGDELLRLAIAKSGQQFYFVFTMQHLVYDAYARDLLFRELEAAYLDGSFPTTEPSRMNQFIKHVINADKSSAVGFWTSYLEGSSTKALLSGPIGSRVGEIQLHKMTIAKTQLRTWRYTLATIIEVSGALAIAQRLDCSDVIFYSDRAGRNLPVAGIQDLVAPTTLFLPLRVHIDQQQTLGDLLCAHHAANTAMMPFEYLGWTELREMGHLRDTLQHSVNMNINPYTPFNKLGAGMGLTVVGEHETCDDPFGINVSVGEDHIEWSLYFDEQFISRATVLSLAADLRTSFLVVSNLHMMQHITVGHILDRIRR